MRPPTPADPYYVATLFKGFFKTWIMDKEAENKNFVPTMKDAEEFVERYLQNGMDIRVFRNVFNREPTTEERNMVKVHFLKLAKELLRTV